MLRSHNIGEVNENIIGKKAINVLINSTYEKADAFYEKLKETEKGREILRRLEKERINKIAKPVSTGSI